MWLSIKEPFLFKYTYQHGVSTGAVMIADDAFQLAAATLCQRQSTRMLGDDRHAQALVNIEGPMRHRPQQRTRPDVTGNTYMHVSMHLACKDKASLNRTLSSPNCLICLATPAVETVILLGLIANPSVAVMRWIAFSTFL